eukprot:gene38774-52368_t
MYRLSSNWPRQGDLGVIATVTVIHTVIPCFVVWATMLRVLNRLSRQPVQDTREFLARMVAFILMGNTDAHLKNWALVYPDGRVPQLAPVYDPVCVAAFFEGVPDQQYAVNRAIDKTLRALTWDDMEGLMKSAGLLRVPRHLALLRRLARAAARCATGMDAIAHCMETFMAPPFNPPADGIGLDGLERAWGHIERATKDGSDREARLNLMSASMQGAMAFQKGLGCVHSLSH